MVAILNASKILILGIIVDLGLSTSLILYGSCHKMLPRKAFLRTFKGLKPYSTESNTLVRLHHKELQLYDDIITQDEEADIAKFLKPILSRKRYEGGDGHLYFQKLMFS